MFTELKYILFELLHANEIKIVLYLPFYSSVFVINYLILNSYLVTDICN